MKLEGSNLYEVKQFNYEVGNRDYAKIELLVFSNGRFSAQATLTKVNPGKKFSTMGEDFETKEEALQHVTKLIEEEIKEDEWVLKTANNIRSLGKQVSLF